MDSNMSAPLVFGDGRACGLELMRILDAGAAPETERRRQARLPLSVPVSIFRRHSSHGIETTTRNVSNSGFYYVAHEVFTIGERLRCVLHLPSFHPGRRQSFISLDCRAMVVRVEIAGPSTYGIACIIEEYQVLQTEDQEQGNG